MDRTLAVATILAWGSFALNLLCVTFWIRARKRLTRQWESMTRMAEVMAAELQLLRDVRKGVQDGEWPDY